MITLLFFGPLAELTAADTVAWEDCADTESLQHAIHARYPALAERKYALAVNSTLASQNTPLLPGSEVAFLPPFSGG